MSQLLTTRWLIRHVMVLCVIIILANFGFWQLRRLDQRRTLNNQIMATTSQTPVQLTTDTGDLQSFHFARVAVTGTFDHEQSMTLRHQTLDNVRGVHLLTPLRVKGTGQAVIVDRGWIPAGDAIPEARAAYDIAGQVTIEGIAYRTQTRPSFLAARDPDLQPGQTRLDAWFRVDIDRIQAQTPYPLWPIFIEQGSSSDNVSDELPRRNSSLTLDEGPHLGYAIQWFSFTVALAVIYLFFIRKELQEEV